MEEYEIFDDPQIFKELLTDGIFVCIDILRSKGFINSERNESVCDYGEMLGKELADLVIKHIETIQLVKSYELIDCDEANEHDCNMLLETNSSDLTSEYDASSKKILFYLEET